MMFDESETDRARLADFTKEEMIIARLRLALREGKPIVVFDPIRIEPEVTPEEGRLMQGLAVDAYLFQIGQKPLVYSNSMRCSRRGLIEHRLHQLRGMLMQFGYAIAKAATDAAGGDFKGFTMNDGEQ